MLPVGGGQRPGHDLSRVCAVSATGQQRGYLAKAKNNNCVLAVQLLSPRISYGFRMESL